MNEKTFAFYVGGINPNNIDDVAGIIKDVRIITEGSALGHNVDIDSTTIDQIMSGCQKYSNGVKVKMDHDGGAGDIPGYVTNFRKMKDDNGEYLLGDLHLFASHPQRNYVLEMAKRIPDTFGLSCFFIGSPEQVDGRMKARCNRVFSCDIVTEPAANPALFSVGPILRSAEISQVDNPKNTIEKPKKTMEPEEFARCMEQYEAGKSAKDAAVIPTKETHEVKPDGSEKHVITKGPTSAPMAENDDEEEKAMSRFAAKFLANLTKSGVRIAPAVTTSEVATQLSAKPTEETQIVTPKTFEDICLELRTKGDDSGKKYGIEESVSFAQRNYPEAHYNYLERCKAEGSAQYQHMQLERAASKDKNTFVPPFVSKVEHWKVQGTPKPGSLR